MADAQNIVYRGNCHCGRYRYELSLPGEIGSATSCTCSVCLKKGYLWLAPPEGSFRVVRDDGNLEEYTSKSLRDKFCNHCGTGVIGQHTAGPLRGQFAVNVRAIQGVNPYNIKIAAIETKDEELEIQQLEKTEPTAHHVFSCHCGNVKAELLVRIQDQEVKEDNCSSCVRNAYIGVYPTKDQVRILGREHGFEYAGLKADLGGPKMGGTVHCKTCGVFVFTNIHGPPITVFDRLPPERKAYALEVYHKNMSLQPLNVRAIEGFQLLSKAIGIAQSDEGTEGYSQLLEPWEGASDAE
ncbi:hypothetical protein N8I77_009538 [Diaporthe amygdali]|uniref:CENP-V/GFA domain-containing protein n=1 Tax=Phomopsis amygdali TaxID=1214568 RepID=A0AAD9SA03_PHOAM|nr:hypothetical protein N8I77_009538 [Diaporthe amygdali]